MRWIARTRVPAKLAQTFDYIGAVPLVHAPLLYGMPRPFVRAREGSPRQHRDAGHARLAGARAVRRRALPRAARSRFNRRGGRRTRRVRADRARLDRLPRARGVVALRGRRGRCSLGAAAHRRGRRRSSSWRRPRRTRCSSRAGRYRLVVLPFVGALAASLGSELPATANLPTVAASTPSKRSPVRGA